MKLIRFALFIAFAISSATAQSTNVTQRASFVLKGTVQTSSGATSVRLSNKDLIMALNATGEYQFGPKAALFFVSAGEQPPEVIVREVGGPYGEVTTTDVGAYFGVTEIGDEVHSDKQSTQWETWNFAFNNGATNETAFLLWGVTEIHSGSIHTPGVGTLAGPQRVGSNVTGVGRVKGAITIFSGTVSGMNATLVTE